ncbi:catalase family protein [Sorangium sp. So ce302]|uniref:catalase family protein n=1 Tax=unclassified Sorangium TaxID=2621164 RepID=UPI003F643EB5
MKTSFWRSAVAIGLFLSCPGRVTRTASIPSLGIAEETLEPNEAALIEAIKEETLRIIRKQYPPGVRPVRRDAHPKTFAVVKAELIVLDDLPKELRYGVFKAPRKFDALVRFSAGGTKVKPDTEPEPRGMAIKLLGVEGEKLLPAEKHEKTQDFIMINFPGFAVSNLKDYLELFRAVAEGPEARAAYMRAHPEIDRLSALMASQVLNNPLQSQYWSEVPYKLGPGAIKFSAKPVSRTGDPRPENPGPDFLREVLLEQLKREDVYFDFMVQQQTDPVKMPIENSTIIWSEELSSFRRVAILRIPKQNPADFKDLALAELLSFTPWHALPEHRPLGSMNRARRAAYEAVSKLRHEMNGQPRSEPTELP